MSSPSPPSFPALYRNHYARIRRAIRCTGVYERHCDDVTQETLLRVYHALPSYDPARKLLPWLVRIAYFTAIDHSRRPEHRELPFAEIDMVDESTEKQTPEYQATAREAERTFCEIAATLPESQRIVFLMHEIDEIPIPDIAEALEIPAGTASSRFLRARKAFDAALGRRRAVEERTMGALATIPPYLASSAALIEVGRTFPEISPEEVARCWGRIVRATAKGAAAGALSRLAALTPAQVVGALLIVGTAGLTTGILGTLALLRSPSNELGAAVKKAAPQTDDAPAPTMANVVAPTEDRVILAAGAPLAEEPGARLTREPEPSPWTERTLLDRARLFFLQGDLDSGLRELGRHAQHFPAGVYAEERESMKKWASALRRQGTEPR